MTNFKGTSTALAALLALGAGAASAQEIRFMCYSDGNECEVYDDLLSRFEAENEGVDVIVDRGALSGDSGNPASAAGPREPGLIWPRSPIWAG